MATDLKKQQAELKNITSAGDGNDTICSKLAALKIEIKQLEGTLTPFLSSGAELVTEEDLSKAEKEIKTWQTEWKRRKRGCMDTAATLSESMDMNRKTLVERCGIDTDEEFGTACPV